MDMRPITVRLRELATRDRLEAAARIEALEAALREITQKRKLDAVAATSMQAIARAALAPALCPTSDPSWPESQPCSVCGAFGPWFDTPQIGECVEAISAALGPEQDK